MKEFVVYTALRAVLFAATLAIVLGVWWAIDDGANVFIAVVVAFVVSGVGSWFVLQRPRAAFASRVEARAERATAAFEALRAKEDEEKEQAAAAQRAADGRAAPGRSGEQIGEQQAAGADVTVDDAAAPTVAPAAAPMSAPTSAPGAPASRDDRS